MDQEDDFCPNCSSILNPVEDIEDESDTEDSKNVVRRGLFMRCNDCNYSRPALTFSTTHFSKHYKKTGGSLDMDPTRISDLIYSKTYSFTKSLECVNEECPSKKEKIRPEIMLITSENHPELGYLCTMCKAIWGKMF
jgi:DNA-directed RNA polymerase subunit M/transcription elongation factor TFIIS